MGKGRKMPENSNCARRSRTTLLQKRLGDPRAQRPVFIADRRPPNGGGIYLDVDLLRVTLLRFSSIGNQRPAVAILRIWCNGQGAETSHSAAPWTENWLRGWRQPINVLRQYVWTDRHRICTTGIRNLGTTCLISSLS
jgi:hypothetical protein